MLWEWVKLRPRHVRRHTLPITVASVSIAAVIACASPAPAPAPTPEPTQAPIQASLPIPTAAPPAVSAGPSPLTGSRAPSPLPAIADLVEGVEPSVASISVESVNRGMFFDFTDEGAGSGIVVRSDGYVVTNYHVIQDVVGIKVDMPDGHTYDADIVGWDIVTDLAVLKVEAEKDLPVISWGESDELRVGDWVVAVGNALALKGGPTVTMGIISAKGRTVRTDRGALYDMIQTDAAINDGNSGGPLMNMNGEVVGISTAMLRQARGIGFAISSETALPIIDSLIEHGRVVRPLMGLNAEDVTSRDRQPPRHQRHGGDNHHPAVSGRPRLQRGPAGWGRRDQPRRYPDFRHEQVPDSAVELRRWRHCQRGLHEREQGLRNVRGPGRAFQVASGAVRFSRT